MKKEKILKLLVAIELCFAIYVILKYFELWFDFMWIYTIKVTLNVSGNVGKGVIKKGDRKGEITIEYSDPGTLTETFNVDGNTAKRIYKKSNLHRPD
ncbi:hypothetical protein Avbf_13399 [Armadillidium vulgare]|nr:hypothetical protein Avbf_13399 [Armadillidium vulgare]